MPKSRRAARILLIDRDPERRRRLTGVLSDQGHIVQAADDAPAALEAQQHEPAELVVANLPGGHDQLGAFRRDYPATRILLLDDAAVAANDVVAPHAARDAAARVPLPALLDEIDRLLGPAGTDEPMQSIVEDPLDAIAEGVLLLDPEDRVVAANRRLLELLPEATAALQPGAPFHALVETLAAGRHYVALTPADGAGEADWPALHCRLHAEGRAAYELGLSENRWLLVRRRALADGRRLLTFTDQSAVRLRERRLAAECDQLRRTLESIPHGVAGFDREQRLLVWNDAYRRMFDLPGDLLRRGRPLADLAARGRARGASLPAEAAGIAGALEQFQPGGRRPVVEWQRADGRVYDAERVATPDGGFVAIHSDVTERRAVEERMRYLATRDTLTGLANRVRFMEALEQAVQRERLPPARHFAVITLDVDRFKAVNESLGHRTGDEVLMLLGRRLAEQARPGDTVARFGEDEFTVLLDDVDDTAEAVALAQQLQARLAEPIVAGEREVQLTCCAGVVLSQPGACAEDYLRDADVAMYRAKDGGRGRLTLFNHEMRVRAAARLRVESELSEAIDAGQVELYYQPIIRLADMRLAGLEALARWRHPERGLVQPAEFIPIAEDSGLIVPLGRWVMGAAIRQIADWHREIGDGGDWYLSVNVSSREVGRRDLPGETQALLEQHRVPAGRLKLEVTESVLMQEPEAAARILAELRRLGIRLCIDDFGTGYSSLAYLHRFPFDTLKIDRSFVMDRGRGVESGPIIASIAGLGRSLGKEVVAEGAETAADVERLRELGCDAAQGYYFSPPLPADRAAALLAHHLKD